MDYFRPAVKAMAGYTPGEWPAPGTGIIKLNSNENPYPPSPQVAAALQGLNVAYLRRYPDPYAGEFCRAVSEVLQVPVDWIIVGNGSDDLLNLLIRACAEGQDRKVVYPEPTYVLYKTLSAIQPVAVATVPYPESFELPIEALVAARGAITLIATPNSPSGHRVPLQDLRILAQQVSGLMVIDEAYVDFAEESALSLVQEFDNVILLRTLSKGYGLAGLRIGFGIAHPALLAGLFKVKESYNVDAIAITLGAAALRDQAYKNARANQIKASRAKLSVDLKHLGFSVLESHGNFVLATPKTCRAESLYLALRERGILIRHFKQPGLDNKLRISVGTEEENATLIAALTNLIHG